MATREQILAQLPELRASSGKTIRDSVITGITRSFTSARYEAIRTRSNPNGAGFVFHPTLGWESVGQHLQATRNLMTMPVAHEDNFTVTLNAALLGGQSYPILNAVLGTAAGAASAGAGLLFTIATTAIDVSRTTNRVLARGGDQVWCVEEIGKQGQRAYHVGAFFLVDPFRVGRSLPSKGWLFHEERKELDLP